MLSQINAEFYVKPTSMVRPPCLCGCKTLNLRAILARRFESTGPVSGCDCGSYLVLGIFVTRPLRGAHWPRFVVLGTLSYLSRYIRLFIIGFVSYLRGDTLVVEKTRRFRATARRVSNHSKTAYCCY